MTGTRPLTAVRLAGFIWMLLAPFVWLGAAFSKMDTAERYNVQLGLATVVTVVAICAAFAAFAGRQWARSVLLALSWSAAGIWIYAGISFSAASDFDVLPIGIGFCFVVLAASIHIDAPSQLDLPGDQT